MPHRPHGDVHVKLEEMGNAQNETIAIDVNRDENGADGSETKLQVNLRIHVIQGNVHVNGHKIDHAVVTAIHLKTRLDKIYKTGIRRSEPAVVLVRIMVVESAGANGVKVLRVQEQIVEINGKAASQIDIKEVVMELGDKLTESKRTITTIKLTNSKIFKKERRADKHLWACKGRLPFPPFSADKNRMKKWRKHYNHNKAPNAEMGENRHGDFRDDDDDDDKDKKHRHHHHHAFYNRFCRWFHGLPVATRAVFCISVILLITLMVASCCICGCKKPKRLPVDSVEKKYDLSESVDLEMEAEPLPAKKPLDKQPLVA